MTQQMLIQTKETPSPALLEQQARERAIQHLERTQEHIGQAEMQSQDAIEAIHSGCSAAELKKRVKEIQDLLDNAETEAGWAALQ